MNMNYYNLVKTVFATVVIPILLLSACTHDTELPTSLDSVCFETEVLPIFQTNCALSGCHGANAEELTLTDYNSIMENINAGDPENSELYQAITSTWGELMPPPPANTLTQEQRNLIYIWIKQGAKNNLCSK